MVILGGLEIVAAGYLLKELHNDSSKEEERDRERRRRRRHHSRDDHHRPHRHDDSPPSRPSRPSQQLMPPQQQGPPRPYSAPPPQNRPQMMPVAMAATAAAMWPRPPPQGPPPQPGAPQSYGTWPQGPPQQQQMMQQRPPQQQPPPQAQWQGRPPPQNGPNNFVPSPLHRPQTNTMYPPPGSHIDMKTGKIQHDMFPPEMPRSGSGGEAREYYEGGGGGGGGGGGRQERQRENSTPQQRPQIPPRPYSAEHNAHSYSQPVISVTPAIHRATPVPHGYAELDSETPGRYQPQQGDEKSRRAKSNSFSGGRYADDEFDMRSPPPAYREWTG